MADAAIATGATRVTADALADIDIVIDAEPLSLGAGEQRELVVTESSEVVVPGQIRIAIRAGDEAHTLTERAGEARETFEALCREGQVDGLAEAREAAGARSEAERVLIETSRSMAQDLRDLTADEIAEMVDRLRASVSAYVSGRRSDSPLPGDLNAAERLASEVETGLAEARQEFERYERDLAQASDALQKVDVGDAGVTARLEQARQVEIDEQGALETARLALGDEKLANQLSTTEAALAESVAALAEANEQLRAEDPESVEELLRNAREAKGRLGDEVHTNEGTARDLRTTLAVKGEEGTANKLDVAKSSLVRLTAAHEQLERRAAAAQLLYETFAKRRSEAHQRYAAPFRESIERLGRLVFGPTLEVELDDALRVSRRTLDGVTLEFDDLSTGAKEQLGMISRLACAAIVASDGGAPVIFDDALGWSDPRRLDRMGAVISSAGRSCQVIVLTCTPGRYASVGSAKVVQLPGHPG